MFWRSVFLATAVSVVCVWSGWAAGTVCEAEGVEVVSPDGKVVVAFELGEGGVPLWSVMYEGRAILLPSALGLELEGAKSLMDDFRIEAVSSLQEDTTWEPVYGERSRVRDHYRAAEVALIDGEDPPRKLTLSFRAYDEGAAFCYSLPEQEGLDKFTIAAEETRFRFAGDYPCYAVYSAQGLYEAVTLSQVKRNCERPLTVLVDDDCCVAVGEARLVDYARMRLRPVKGEEYTLAPHLGSAVKAFAPYTTPWRVVLVGHTPGELLARNYLFENLNAPCAIADPSWIKPGKVIREVTLTTEGGKACVDFAVERGLQYIEYDAGWYGDERDERSDATTITRNAKKSGVQGELGLHEVIEYGAERGIGVLVYVNRRHLERQLDEILPLYRDWGIKGVKYGFVQVGSQEWTTWLHEAVRKAADHQLMVDVHDEYRPTGYSRTYPNLMTQEGVRGNETMPTAEHNCIQPFTRYLCGAADHTICWYTDRIQATHAHQLATAVVFYSPLQFVHWYDRPQQYQGEPELDFFKYVPTVWDETKVIHGKIGEYVTIARRSGEEWFVGSLNGVEERRLSIPLDFLETGRSYLAWVYADAAPDGSNPTGVAVSEASVEASSVLEAPMARNGGHAIRLVPLKGEE